MSGVGPVTGDGHAAPACVGVLGLGLLGGSVALDLLERGHRVHGFDVDPVQCEHAAAAGVEVVDGPAGLAGCDLVLLAVPAPALAEALAVLDAAADGPLVVTDVASVQSPSVLGTAGVARRHVRHVGGHPMTGTERSGFRAARRGMFDGSPWLLTPDATTDVGALAAVVQLVLLVGGAGVVVDADEHDRVVAHLSHLPHVLAYSAYREVSTRFDAPVEGLAGGSFQGLTRVAATRPAFWAEVLHLNRAAVADAIGGLRERLDELEGLLRDGADVAALTAVLAEGHRSVGRPRPEVPTPTPLPATGPLGAEALTALRTHGAAGLAIAALDGSGVSWSVL